MYSNITQIRSIYISPSSVHFVSKAPVETLVAPVHSMGMLHDWPFIQLTQLIDDHLILLYLHGLAANYADMFWIVDKFGGSLEIIQQAKIVNKHQNGTKHNQ